MYFMPCVIRERLTHSLWSRPLPRRRQAFGTMGMSGCRQTSFYHNTAIFIGSQMPGELHGVKRDLFAAHILRGNGLHGGDPEDDEIFAYEGAQLDFAKLTLTHVLLNLPMRFLCKEDCRGFEEYEEVNQHKHCRDDANVQRPFAALQQLLAEKSDNKE